MAAPAAAFAPAAVAAPSLSSTIENVQKYRGYKEDMNKFTSKLDEILYICDMIDVDRIDQFLINFLETYNFYKGKKEDDTGKEDDDTGKEDDDIGYSDLSEKNIEDIKKNENFHKMTTYISTNSDNIKKMCEKLEILYEKIKKYLEDTAPEDTTIKTDILNQKQNIIEQLEKIIRLLEIRTNTNSIAPLPFEKLKFYDVALINKNNIICVIGGYGVFKGIYNKKLHVLNNEDSQLINKFEEVFKYEFYIIYTTLHEVFKETLGSDKPNITNIIKYIKEIKEAFENYPPATQQPPQ
jgi:soluble cytochrome b562